MSPANFLNSEAVFENDQPLGTICSEHSAFYFSLEVLFVCLFVLTNYPFDLFLVMGRESLFIWIYLSDALFQKLPGFLGGNGFLHSYHLEF